MHAKYNIEEELDSKIKWLFANNQHPLLARLLDDGRVQLPTKMYGGRVYVKFNIMASFVRPVGIFVVGVFTHEKLPIEYKHLTKISLISKTHDIKDAILACLEQGQRRMDAKCQSFLPTLWHLHNHKKDWYNARLRLSSSDRDLVKIMNTLKWVDYNERKAREHNPEYKLSRFTFFNDVNYSYGIR